jgi:hypothetical protein
MAGAIGRFYRMPVDELVGRCRTKSVATARAVFARALRELRWSYPEIGDILGRDHTTIIALVKRLKTAEWSAIEPILAPILKEDREPESIPPPPPAPPLPEQPEALPS